MVREPYSVLIKLKVGSSAFIAYSRTNSYFVFLGEAKDATVAKIWTLSAQDIDDDEIIVRQ